MAMRMWYLILTSQGIFWETPNVMFGSLEWIRLYMEAYLLTQIVHRFLNGYYGSMDAMQNGVNTLFWELT